MYDQSYSRTCEIPKEALEPQPKTGFEELPEEKLKAMKEYALKLRRKFPHMKAERLQKKVAEYFKVKLV